jgi:heme oxygenase
MHARLKTRTSAWHARVERAFDLKRVVRDLDHYIWTIRCLRQAHELIRWEAERLDRQTGSGRLAMRLAWMDIDLAALGAASPPPPEMEWSLASSDHLLGALYVLNGSALGGQIILGRVCIGLGLSPRSGARYFRGDGRRTRTIWQAFLDELADIDPLSARGDRVEQGALQTFSLLHQLLSRTVLLRPLAVEAVEPDIPTKKLCRNLASIAG